VQQVWGDLDEGYQSERALVKAGVRDFQPRRGDDQVIVEQDIDVNQTGPEARALSASHLLLYLLGQFQQSLRRQIGFAAAHEVEEPRLI